MTIPSYFSSLWTYNFDHKMLLQFLKSRGSAFLLRKANGLCQTQRPSVYQLQEKSFSKLSEFNWPMATSCVQNGIGKFPPHWRNNFYDRPMSGQVVQIHQGDKRRYFFSKFDQFVTLRLKTRKTNVNHTKLPIVIIATQQQNCPLTAFCKLLFKDLKKADEQFFS